MRIAADVILQEAGTYEAPEYWKKRSEVSKDLEERLNQKL